MSADCVLGIMKTFYTLHHPHEVVIIIPFYKVELRLREVGLTCSSSLIMLVSLPGFRTSVS